MKITQQYYDGAGDGWGIALDAPLSASPTPPERIQEYAQHKDGCIVNMTVSNGIGLVLPACTCGLESLLTALRAAESKDR